MIDPEGMFPSRRLWVDDLRDPPDDGRWWVARTSAEALGALDAMPLNWWEEISLDHDLGGDDTARPVVIYLIEHEYVVPSIRSHSMNPIGRTWLEGTIERYLR